MELKEETLKNPMNDYRDKLNICTEELAVNTSLLHGIQVLYGIQDGSYVINFDPDIWNIATAAQFCKYLSKQFPKCCFALLPKSMDIINAEDVETYNV